MPLEHIWMTEIKAVDPVDGHIGRWNGPRIKAISRSVAEQICRDTLPYPFYVVDRVAADSIDGKKWVDYEKSDPQLN